MNRNTAGLLLLLLLCPSCSTAESITGDATATTHFSLLGVGSGSSLINLGPSGSLFGVPAFPGANPLADPGYEAFMKQWMNQYLANGMEVVHGDGVIPLINPYPYQVIAEIGNVNVGTLNPQSQVFYGFRNGARMADGAYIVTMSVDAFGILTPVLKYQVVIP